MADEDKKNGNGATKTKTKVKSWSKSRSRNRKEDNHVEENLEDLERAEGILEVLPKGFGFLRSAANSFQPTDRDIYVAQSQIQRFKIRSGSMVKGPIAPQKQKGRAPALRAVEEINGAPPEEHALCPHFKELTVIDPNERFVMDGPEVDISLRILDLVAPIGMGQRSLIVAPPRSGKTVLLQSVAKHIAEEYEDVHLMVMLIDERPEEITDFKMNLPTAEVVASSLDSTGRGHIKVSELALERARRLVEAGKDVVIILDSLTRMARAYNREGGGSRKTMSGGLDASAMEKPREFFGSARNLEGAGSLTIIATALIDTGSKMDQVIFEEFKGTGNQELVLSRQLADRRIFPAIDVTSSGTRKEEKLRDEFELNAVWHLRRVLTELTQIDAMDKLKKNLEACETNDKFLEKFAK
jgi:transcription termination factor Rho